jgi:hypothetical protein
MSEIGDKLETSQVCWFMLIIPALGRLRQEDCKFQPSLVCRVGPCLKKKRQKTNNWAQADGFCNKSTQSRKIKPGLFSQSELDKPQSRILLTTGLCWKSG